MPLLDPDDADLLRTLTLEEISQVITPDRVDGYVQGLFNGHRRIHVRDLPAELFDEQLRKGIEAMFFAYRGFTSDPDRIHLIRRGYNRDILI